ncbi:hypothetical protein OG280_39525 [Streptomyces virginiae]|uniref:hypothetical protein n=1 Tax=Streptomyces virginiae TaxID=1961 RepID=UPI0032552A50
MITGPQPCRDLARARARYVAQCHVLAQFEPAGPGLLPGLLRPHGTDRFADDHRQAPHLCVRLDLERVRDGPERGGQRLPVPEAVAHHRVEQTLEHHHARVVTTRQHGPDLVGERTE